MLAIRMALGVLLCGTLACGRSSARDARDANGVDGGPPDAASGSVQDGGAGVIDGAMESGADAQAPALTCGPDGNVWRMDGRGERAAMVEQCAVQHGSCEQGVCGCSAFWAGERCDTCVVFAAAGHEGGDGSSWREATDDLQLAMDTALSRVDPRAGIEACEVWVAEGSYLPTKRSPLNRLAPGGEPRDDEPESVWRSFLLREAIHVYGGFAGDERARDGRDPSRHESVLSGAVGEPGEPQGNSRHVVLAADDTLLDGLVIEGGHGVRGEAASTLSGACGTGLLALAADVQLRDVIFRAQLGEGRALCLSDNTTMLEDVTFEGTEGSRVGHLYARRVHFDAHRLRALGARHYPAAVFVGSEVRIRDSRLEGNRAAMPGAALHFTESTASLEGSELVDNRVPAAVDGGAVSAENETTLQVTNCVFDGNSAGDRGFGGAIHVAGRSGLVLEDSELVDNRSKYGGAITVSSSEAAIRNCLLQNNAATYAGGAVFHAGSGPLEVHGCSFRENAGGKYGGAAYIDSDAGAEVVASDFLANEAEAGGAIYQFDVANGISMWLEASRFEDNVATLEYGGALASQAPAFVVNSTFWRNRANLHGGAIAAVGARHYVHHSSFAQNESALGGASIGCGGGRTWKAYCHVTNSLLWDEQALYAWPAAPDNDGKAGTFEVQYSSAPEAQPGTGNVQLEPEFVDVDTGDLRVHSTSPTVDRGSQADRIGDRVDRDRDGVQNEPVPFDIQGLPRVVGAETDLGAYEVQP